MELYPSSKLVQNLLRKRDLLLAGDRAHEEIRPALVICGGAMRGVYGAGAAIAFHRLGLANCFDVVVGISTGAAIASYFLAGEEQTSLGTSIYYEECLEGFISFWRWPIADVDHIERTMRHGRKCLDIDAVLAHRSRFFAGVTCWKTGEGHLLDVKDAYPEPFAAIKSSFAITELYRKPVVVNGRKFTDGSTSMDFPVAKVLREFNPTDLLVLANCPQSYPFAKRPWTRRVLTPLLTAGLAPQVRAHACGHTDLWTENLMCLQNESVNIHVLWGPNSVGRLTRDFKLLRAAAEEGVRDTLKLFGQPHLPFSLL